MITIDEKLDRVGKRGWLDVKVDPTIDIFAEIARLKKKKMQLFSPIITKMQTSRMLLILSETVSDFRRKQSELKLRSSFSPVFISWPKRRKF